MAIDCGPTPKVDAIGLTSEICRDADTVGSRCFEPGSRHSPLPSSVSPRCAKPGYAESHLPPGPVMCILEEASDGTTFINQCGASTRCLMERRYRPHRDLEAARAGQDPCPPSECAGRWARGPRRPRRRAPGCHGLSDRRLTLLGGSARPQGLFIRPVWRELHRGRLSRR